MDKNIQNDGLFRKRFGALQFQQPLLSGKAAGIPRKATVRPHHPVAGDHDGNGVVPHRTADSLGAGTAEDPGQVSVGDGLPPGNLPEKAKYFLPERRACGQESWKKIRFRPGKVYIQPFLRL